MTAETTASILAEQLRAETAPNRNTGLIDLTLLTAAADELGHLQQWKAEASMVLDQWEVVWLAARQPGPLGASKAAAVAEEFERLDRTRPIVDAVVARHQHRATYPARHDHADLDSYAAATEAWLIADHNLGRAITRAAEAHLGCVDDGWQTGTEQADTGSPA